MSGMPVPMQKSPRLFFAAALLTAGLLGLPAIHAQPLSADQQQTLREARAGRGHPGREAMLLAQRLGHAGNEEAAAFLIELGDPMLLAEFANAVKGQVSPGMEALALVHRRHPRLGGIVLRIVREHRSPELMETLLADLREAAPEPSRRQEAERLARFLGARGDAAAASLLIRMGDEGLLEAFAASVGGRVGPELEAVVIANRRHPQLGGAVLRIAQYHRSRELLDALLDDMREPGANPSPAAVAGVHRLFGDWAAAGTAGDVERFLARGAPPDGAGPSGVTPLLRAAQGGNHDVIRVLLAAGADPNAAASGETALFLVARHQKPCPSGQPAKDERSVASARLLLAHGSHPSIPLQEDGRTALHEAVRVGCMPMIALLVDSGADVNAEAKDGELEGLTPTQSAEDRKRPEIAGYLRSKGGTVNELFKARREIRNAPLRLLPWIYGSD